MVFMSGDGEKFENGSLQANQPEREVVHVHLSEASVASNAWRR